MKSIAVLKAAVLATVVSPANAVELKLRCKNPQVEYANSTLYIDEVNGRITRIWDADGYKDTSPATFKDGVWRWVGTIPVEAGEPDIPIDLSLDRRTGEVFAAIQVGSGTLLPTGAFCR